MLRCGRPSPGRWRRPRAAGRSPRAAGRGPARRRRGRTRRLGVTVAATAGRRRGRLVAAPPRGRRGAARRGGGPAPASRAAPGGPGGPCAARRRDGRRRTPGPLHDQLSAIHAAPSVENGVRAPCPGATPRRQQTLRRRSAWNARRNPRSMGEPSCGEHHRRTARGWEGRPPGRDVVRPAAAERDAGASCPRRARSSGCSIRASVSDADEYGTGATAAGQRKNSAGLAFCAAGRRPPPAGRGWSSEQTLICQVTVPNSSSPITGPRISRSGPGAIDRVSFEVVKNDSTPQELPPGRSKGMDGPSTQDAGPPGRSMLRYSPPRLRQLADIFVDVLALEGERRSGFPAAAQRLEAVVSPPLLATPQTAVVLVNRTGRCTAGENRRRGRPQRHGRSRAPGGDATMPGRPGRESERQGNLA